MVFGWTRFYRLSTALVAFQLRRHIATNGAPEVIIYTLPQYAGVADKFRGCLQAYYAYDAYRFYGGGWNSERIRRLEGQLLNSCNVGFAISKQLQRDFEKLTDKPIFYSPNAVASSLVGQMAGGPPERPPELRDVAGKIVGCVGQISENAYDWRLIEGVAEALPDHVFVFVGPLADEPGGSRGAVQRRFCRHNIRWLGPKPHAEVWRYTAAFDICFGPYALTALNERRSPLRLYDYLATDKPILFTPISEVCEHREHVEVGGTIQECVSLIRKMTRPDYHIDLETRRRFLARNTWEARAAEFWDKLQSVGRSL